MKSHKQNNPLKKFIPAPGDDGCNCNICPYMRLNTAEKVLNSLISLSPEIELEENIRIKALAPIQKMLSLSN